MVTLKDEISSQENMEQWMSQLGHPENPISNKGVLVRLQPQFVSCDFEKRENCIAFEALPWEQNPGGTLHGGIMITCFDVAFLPLLRKAAPDYHRQSDNYLSQARISGRCSGIPRAHYPSGADARQHDGRRTCEPQGEGCPHRNSNRYVYEIR